MFTIYLKDIIYELYLPNVNFILHCFSSDFCSLIVNCTTMKFTGNVFFRAFHRKSTGKLITVVDFGKNTVTTIRQFHNVIIWQWNSHLIYWKFLTVLLIINNWSLVIYVKHFSKNLWKSKRSIFGQSKKH